MGLQGKTAIITGASSGIGLAIATALAEVGANVVLAARSEADLSRLHGDLISRGLPSLPVATDITCEENVVGLFRRTVDYFGGLDLLINNAGVNVVSPTEDLALADWRRVLDTNVTGAFLCIREAFRHMKPRKRGRIISIGSVASQRPRPDSIAYTASKFALEGLTRSAALDGRAHGISVSALHPGNIDTALWSGDDKTIGKEGTMPAAEIARIVVLMAELPPDMNMLEATVIPLGMPFVGRG